MRLLHTQTLETHEFSSASDSPPFAISSWAGHNALANLTAHDARVESARMPRVCRTPSVSASAIEQACQTASSRGVSYLWVKDLGHSEHRESKDDREDFVRNYALWLQECKFCMVFMENDGLLYDTRDVKVWRRSAYWQNAWSIPELIFARLELFDFSGKHLASKLDIISLLSDVSGINEAVLLDHKQLHTIPLATRISWAARQDASEDMVPEDTSYALAAVVGVQMTVNHGEKDEKSFERLQRELLKTTKDVSILAWCSTEGDHSQQLARSPADFSKFARETTSPLSQGPWRFDGTVVASGKGLEVRSRMLGGLRSRVLVEVGHRPRGPGRPDERIGIYLQRRKESYVRTDTKSLVNYAAYGGTFYTLNLNIDGDTAPESANSNGEHSVLAAEASLDTGNLLNNKNQLPSVLGSKRDHSGNTRPSHRRLSSGNLPTPPPAPSEMSVEDESDTDDDDGSRSTLGSSTVRTEPGMDTPRACTTGNGSSPDSFTVEDSILSVSKESLREIKQEATRPSLDVHGILSSIVQVAYEEICRATSSDPLRPISDNEKLSPRKRARIEGQKPQTTNNNAGPSEDSRRHFACPFYAVSSVQYQKCLLKHGLETINQVRDHIARDHRRPPYCPRCRVIFSDNDQRDEHIQLRICPVLPINRIEGLGDGDIEKMVREDDIARYRRLGDEARWYRLLSFTGAAAEDVKGSPYLCEGYELALSRLRTFWAARGHQFVEKALLSGGWPDLGLVEMGLLEAMALDGLIATLHRDLGAGLRR